MSNENNEEIELFDYMDEESESRKIPVNKKEKTGGKSGRSKKKKKAGSSPASIYKIINSASKHIRHLNKHIDAR